MQKMKLAILTLLLAATCLSTCSCSVSTFDPTYGFNLDKFGITEEEIYTQHEAWPVRRRSGGMKDMFAVNRVCIVVYPFANNYAYTPEDFAFLGFLFLLY